MFKRTIISILMIAVTAGTSMADVHQGLPDFYTRMHNFPVNNERHIKSWCDSVLSARQKAKACYDYLDMMVGRGFQGSYQAQQAECSLHESDYKRFQATYPQMDYQSCSGTTTGKGETQTYSDGNLIKIEIPGAINEIQDISPDKILVTSSSGTNQVRVIFTQDKYYGQFQLITSPYLAVNAKTGEYILGHGTVVNASMNELVSAMNALYKSCAWTEDSSNKCVNISVLSNILLTDPDGTEVISSKVAKYLAVQGKGKKTDQTKSIKSSKKKKK